MTEQQFWKIIEKSWADSPNLNQKRINTIKTNDEELLEDLHNLFENDILNNLMTRLFELNKIDLTAFIHLLEKKYTISIEQKSMITLMVQMMASSIVDAL